MVALTRLSGPLLKLSYQGLGGWHLYWFEIGGGRVKYFSSLQTAIFVSLCREPEPPLLTVQRSAQAL